MIKRLNYIELKLWNDVEQNFMKPSEKNLILKNRKLIIGITAPQSVMLLEGQLKYFIDKGYIVDLLAPKTEQTIDFCKKEDAIFLPISIKREISVFQDCRTLFQIIKIFRTIKPDIINLGTPKVSLLGTIAV